MKTLKLLCLSLVICLFISCGGKNTQEEKSDNNVKCFSASIEEKSDNNVKCFSASINGSDVVFEIQTYTEKPEFGEYKSHEMFKSLFFNFNDSVLRAYDDVWYNLSVDLNQVKDGLLRYLEELCHENNYVSIHKYVDGKAEEVLYLLTPVQDTYMFADDLKELKSEYDSVFEFGHFELWSVTAERIISDFGFDNFSGNADMLNSFISDEWREYGYSTFKLYCLAIAALDNKCVVSTGVGYSDDNSSFWAIDGDSGKVYVFYVDVEAKRKAEREALFKKAQLEADADTIVCMRKGNIYYIKFFDDEENILDSILTVSPNGKWVMNYEKSIACDDALMFFYNNFDESTFKIIHEKYENMKSNLKYMVLYPIKGVDAEGLKCFFDLGKKKLYEEFADCYSENVEEKYRNNEKICYARYQNMTSLQEYLGADYLEGFEKYKKTDFIFDEDYSKINDNLTDRWKTWSEQIYIFEKHYKDIIKAWKEFENQLPVILLKCEISYKESCIIIFDNVEKCVYIKSQGIDFSICRRPSIDDVIVCGKGFKYRDESYYAFKNVDDFKTAFPEVCGKMLLVNKPTDEDGSTGTPYKYSYLPSWASLFDSGIVVQIMVGTASVTSIRDDYAVRAWFLDKFEKNYIPFVVSEDRNVDFGNYCRDELGGVYNHSDIVECCKLYRVWNIFTGEFYAYYEVEFENARLYRRDVVDYTGFKISADDVYVENGFYRLKEEFLNKIKASKLKSFGKKLLQNL